MKRQPPTSFTPKDTTICGPCVWLHAADSTANRDSYLTVVDVLNTYLDVMRKKFTQG